MKQKIRILSFIVAICILFAACKDDPPILGNEHIVSSVSVSSVYGKKYRVLLMSVDRTPQDKLRMWSVLHTDSLYTVGDTIEIK